ncbi:hypothetical protein ELI49_36545 [Rhizobium ruizarguesonis]|jgi:hypothetical protein|uniref:Uncharacterized protein n=1 Tax=Rhizobium ruizarguesonis TaxID=2081791 RepID=A0AAE8QBW2_9HYPH|nr:MULTISPECIES: hypothetical protein [Rhizobium]QIO49248.1 hypothetical protein HA464_37370 [Rhizobium leguminosarum bv. trifolii]QJS32390.1 hypothetical protein RLTA1_35985 [Rhizobium leguminosarum bv. trifolii TA1]MDI5930157.1 hypothetical protein [Rhizobium leguminosarum]TAT70380.1 hypothetical protein ELI56_37260 [Rhizobium ruizarguesonis]TAT71712.1 hypothetical protein ELI52_34680 [Rhizobium ruizarguesonis]
MPQLLTINVKNYESQTQNFHFFQQPAIYTGGGQVYSNSLAHSVSTDQAQAANPRRKLDKTVAVATTSEVHPPEIHQPITAIGLARRVLGPTEIQKHFGWSRGTAMPQAP